MLTFLIGIAFGFFGSMPVAGPVSAIVLERALARRSLSGLFVAAGSAIAESVYAFLAAWGLSGLVLRFPALMHWTRIAGSLILLALGIYFIVKPAPQFHARKASRGVEARSFFLGFALTAFNPTLIVTWSAAVTSLYSTGLVPVDPSSALPFASGATIGVIGWFSVFLGLIHRYHGKLSPTTIHRIVRGTGVVLVGIGVWTGWRVLSS